MIYLKWKLSNDTWGVGPEATIATRGGRAQVSEYVQSDGYRLGYLTETADLTGLETWDVAELTEAEALTFAQQHAMAPNEGAFIKTAEQIATGFVSSYWCESNPGTPPTSDDE